MDGACSGVTCGSLIGCDSLQVISVVPNTSFWLLPICKPLKPPCTPVSSLYFLGFLLPVYKFWPIDSGCWCMRVS